MELNTRHGSGSPIRFPWWRIGRARSLKERAISVQGRLPSQVGVEHPRARLDIVVADHVDHPRQRFPLVDGVGDHAFETRAHLDGIDRPLVCKPVGPSVVAGVQDDLVSTQVTADIDQCCRVASKPCDLLQRLLGLRGSVDADYPPGAPLKPMPNPAFTIRTSAPRIRLRRMLPTRS